MVGLFFFSTLEFYFKSLLFPALPRLKVYTVCPVFLSSSLWNKPGPGVAKPGCPFRV